MLIREGEIMKTFKFRTFIATLILAVLPIFDFPRAQAVELLVSSASTDDVKRYNGTTGAFIDTFASGGGLELPTFLIFTPAAPPPM
jgi:hypothetical protein